MKKDQSKFISNLPGFLGVIVIILSITLLVGKTIPVLNRSIIACTLQLVMGLMFLSYGFKENRSKVKSGRMYYFVGVLILVSAIYSVHSLIAGLI